MAKTATASAPRVKRNQFQRWCDNWMNPEVPNPVRGHGARRYISKDTGLRYQTVHDIYTGKRRALPETARLIAKAIKKSKQGPEVLWTSLVG